MKLLKHISNPTMLLTSEQIIHTVTTITNNLFSNNTYTTLTPYTRPFLTHTTRHSHTVKKSIPHRDQFFLKRCTSGTYQVVHFLRMYFNYCIP